MSPQVERELLAFVEHPEGARAMADFLDVWPGPGPHMLERAMAALSRGELFFEGWSATPGLVGPDQPMHELVELAGDEPVDVPIHAVILELVDPQDRPVVGARFVLVDPEGRSHAGVLDDEGRAHVRGIRAAGACKVAFPDFDSAAWSYVSAHPL